MMGTATVRICQGRAGRVGWAGPVTISEQKRAPRTIMINKVIEELHCFVELRPILPCIELAKRQAALEYNPNRPKVS